MSVLREVGESLPPEKIITRDHAVDCTSWHGGQGSLDQYTAVVFAPHEFIEKLAALVPPPHANLVTYQGVDVAEVRSSGYPKGAL